MYVNFYPQKDNSNSKNFTSPVLFSNHYPLKDDEELYIKNLPYTEQKKMLIDYAELNEIVDALEIADALQLDVFEVNDIMKQLIKEGILEEL